MMNVNKMMKIYDDAVKLTPYREETLKVIDDHCRELVELAQEGSELLFEPEEYEVASYYIEPQSGYVDLDPCPCFVYKSHSGKTYQKGSYFLIHFAKEEYEKRGFNTKMVAVEFESRWNGKITVMKGYRLTVAVPKPKE